MLMRGYQRGDTIIEVLFAITIFSLVAVAGLAIMNQGTAIAQRSLEINLVREQIDTQTDALRYLHDAYVADYGTAGPATDLWTKITSKQVKNAQDFNSIASGGTCHMPAPGDNPFALDVTKLSSNPLLVPVADAATYAQVRTDVTPTTAEGIWIQAVQSDTVKNGGNGLTQPTFYDFHISACWTTPGQSVPITLGTIVRLYDPQT